jgi:hypothetical protein
MDVQLVICKATSFKYERNRPRLDEAISKLYKMFNEISSRVNNTKKAGKRMWNPATDWSFAIRYILPEELLVTA